jgi:membrane fusion protein (multidrug efflux system)
MPVEVARAGRSLVQDRFEAIGTIEAIDAITVVSEIDATVINIPFREGSEVRAGELLAQLDDLQPAAELARAEALLAQSSASYERVRKVVEQKAAAEQDLDDAAAALKVAEANLAVAQARLAKTRITAPFDGIVGTRRVSKGTFLRAGQAITELANIDQIRVHFSVPERFLARLTAGAEVTVSTTAYQGVDLTGTVIAVEPIIDSETRSARVVARVQNTKRRFRPGMSANISAVLGERTDAITIPNEAVFSSGRDAFVFLVKPDSTVTRIPLMIGTRMEKEVEVISGLEPEAMVVRAGHQKLFEGARVLPVASQADTALHE